LPRADLPIGADIVDRSTLAVERHTGQYALLPDFG
jgi:hypothetical protein